MAGPITPKEAEAGRHRRIPDEVFEAFNELIMETGGRVMQDAIVARILSKMPDATREEIFQKGWLDVETAYRKKGWSVEYDKPGYNESYGAFYVFEPKGRQR